MASKSTRSSECRRDNDKETAAAVFHTDSGAVETLISNDIVFNAAKRVVDATKDKTTAKIFSTCVPWESAGRLLVHIGDPLQRGPIDGYAPETKRSIKIIEECTGAVEKASEAGMNRSELWRRACAVIWFYAVYHDGANNKRIAEAMACMLSRCKKGDISFIDWNTECGVETI